MKPPPYPNSMDWFLPAINAKGGVRESLAEVIRAEEEKIAFVNALQTSLCAYRGRSSDSLSELRRRIQKLSETLDFRVGMLAPERRGAWFRESLKQKTGPFPASILSEPVFCSYEADQVEAVRAALLQSWQQRKVLPLPFGKGPCLWLTLLELNQAFEEICRLSPPFQKLHLTKLPEDLPPGLDSPSLLGFLRNVNRLAQDVQAQLEECFTILWEPSSRFWEFQSQEARQRGKRSNQYHQTADDIRSQFRKRRQEQARRQAFGQDTVALQFMEFNEIPTATELKKRYLTLARRMHPDRPDGSEEAFKQLTRSYKHLQRLLKDDSAGD